VIPFPSTHPMGVLVVGEMFVRPQLMLPG
jgi:hypothetical protein